MKFNDFDWNDVIYEAPGDPEDELSASDYTDANNVEVEPAGEEEDLGAEDYTETDSEEPVEDETEEMSEEDMEENPEEYDLGEEENDNMSEDDSSNDEQIDNEKNKDEADVKQKNKYLINDFIELHTRQGEILQKIKTDRKFNAFTNPTIGQVKKNLEKLQQVTYDYIIDKFSKETYIANLYQFNLIIQAMNVNVGMLERVADSKVRELEKKKKPAKKKDKKK
jgi:hypothetical protein